MLRVVLPPLITAYAIFVAMVALAVRKPVPRPRRLGDGSASSRSRRVIGTIVGGYAAFLVIVLVFHVWVAEEPDAFPSALWGGAFLCGITLILVAGRVAPQTTRAAPAMTVRSLRSLDSGCLTTRPRGGSRPAIA